ncbi:MAG: hypothetical protein ABT20_10780 [Rubrivivax sp. SCN 70-15]|nr:MAG: hypothetical protein ABT20_10780 [Rubrivivax sp. SCN 70-15]
MKALIATALLAASLPSFAADVGVSVQISQPGVYGRIDIGRFPQPELIVQQPVIIGRPVVAAPQPVYLWVPPGQQKHWGRYCARYRACGVPVYFVQDRWYRDHVMTQRDRRDDRRDERRDGWRGDPHDRGHEGGHGRGREHERD